MNNPIDQIVDDYDAGRMTRRQLLGKLGALLAVAGGGATALAADAGEGEPTFQATELNHIALRVTDVKRSRDFYMQHLGLKHSSLSADSAFLTCGTNFVALFRGDTSRMDHYCYAVRDYDVATAEEKLRATNMKNIRRTSGRIYFSDPDGLTVQLAATEHMP
jgi:catechol 2,3-dioxygenase-like lactoylglutathione lyase family enzyme